MIASKNLDRAVFFDRDGVLTIPDHDQKEQKDYAPTTVEGLKLYPDAIAVIKKLQSKEFLTFVISNQPDISLGKINESTKHALEQEFQQMLSDQDIRMNEIVYCHHHEKSTNPDYPSSCTCRKPKPGMILSLADKWSIDLSNSFVIGDTWKDVMAGKSAGCKTILIQRPWSHQEKCTPDYYIDNLANALDIILPR